ncbi:ral guanine nucleotide dissociation stimulator-like isoform X1 [Felis catus]|uniref:ral guanine nucleotide dissociation stimulator-like isoform X1 n=3 Tax=Felis catus TaxID=9685 RepID=UPI001D198F0D|nr:ral guanine nucleotide dissociation stimulator-like isoform X1 [Felis catus]
MFSCCFPRYRGSGCQKPQCAGLLRCWRGFLNPRWRCLRMFSSRSHKSHMPQMEENLNESPCSTSLKERRKPHAISTKPRWLRGTKVTRGDDNENCVLWTIDAGLLKQRVEHLVPAFLGRDPTYVSTFLGTYTTFTTTQKVLEVLFMRAISSILGTWLDHYPEDFFRPPDFTSLKLLQAYVGVHMPGSELQRRARLLYSWRKHREPNEPESLAMAPAPEPRSDVPQERSPAISVVPTAASQPRLPEATSSPGAQRVRESETLTAASPPGQEVLPALADSQELEEPPAPLVAPEHEQPPAPAGGVTEGLEEPPAAAEQPASAPQQRLMSAAAPKDEFPDLFIAFFVISVVLIEVFTVLIY